MPVGNNHARSDEKPGSIAIAIFFIMRHDEYRRLGYFLIDVDSLLRNWCGGKRERVIGSFLKLLENFPASGRFFLSMEFFALLLEILAGVAAVPKPLTINFVIGAECWLVGTKRGVNDEQRNSSKQQAIRWKKHHPNTKQRR